MPQNSFAPFMQAPYPCYWLPHEGDFALNPAAVQLSYPAPSADQVREIMEAAAQNMRRAGVFAPAQLPLSPGALQTQALTLLPFPDGLAGVLRPGARQPLLAFGRQMREPISNMFATLPLLAKQRDDAQAPYLERLQQNCYALLRNVSKLECAGLLENGEYERSTFDFGAMVSALCASVADVCKGAGAPLRTRLTAEALPVRGSAALLEQAVLNLLRNSMQYTREGNEINVSLTKKSGHALLVVADAGLGIRPENLGRVFEAYFSADPYADTDSGPGLGLGLATVRQTAQAFGGRVAIESRFGEGTSVSLSLPLDDAPATRLESDRADYLLNQYSPLFIHLEGFCRVPRL